MALFAVGLQLKEKVRELGTTDEVTTVHDVGGDERVQVGAPFSVEELAFLSSGGKRLICPVPECIWHGVKSPHIGQV